MLVDSPYDKPEEDFIQSTGIQVYLFPLPANKIAGTKANMQELSATVNEVLAKLLDAENHPILIHYYQGKVCLTFKLNGMYSITLSNDSNSTKVGALLAVSVGCKGRLFQTSLTNIVNP